MNYSRWIPLVLLTLAVNAYALTPTVEIVEQFDDLKMIAFIGEQDVNDNPQWNPDEGAPPLTISQAIQSIRAFNKASAKTGAIKEIELRPVSRQDNRWHYLIKLENKVSAAKFDIFVVLMSGKVIPAIIEPQTYK